MDAPRVRVPRVKLPEPKADVAALQPKQPKDSAYGPEARRLVKPLQKQPAVRRWVSDGPTIKLEKDIHCLCGYISGF